MASYAAFSPPHSCDFCRKLVVYKRDRKWWEKALGTSPDVEAHIDGLLSIRARDWLLQMMASAKSRSSARSSFARFLEDYAVFDCTLAEARLAANAGCNSCIEITSSSPLHDRVDRENLFLACSTGKGYFGVLVLENFHWNDKPRLQLKNGGTFEVLAQFNDPASNEILTRPINIAPSSEDSFRRVKRWQHKCLKTHHNCPKPSGTFMPTRVLEIVKHADWNGYRLQLKETLSMEPEPYAALSYCWGGPQTMASTKDSYQRNLTIIDQQPLPASVSDAVLVAEKIGLRYLWIDAFCIIRDDPVDKNWEIAKMPLIYSQAAVTVVASRARTVADGFLHARPKMGMETPDRIFELPFRCSDNKMGSVVLLPHIISSTEPIDLRAWSLQERLLSPRIIEYGTLQTRWICQEFLNDNSPVDGFKSTVVQSNERPDSVFTSALQIILATSEVVTLVQSDKGTLRDHWARILIAYTHRALTFGTDRLPAISSIAAHFGKALCDEYKAGLWKSDMEYQLLWERKAYNNDLRRPLKLRPLEYQGPSWSWAAINEPIYTGSRMEYPHSNMDCEILDYNIRIHSMSAKLSAYDPSFGAVESASVQLRGRLSAVELTHEERSSNAGTGSEALWTFKRKHDTGQLKDLIGIFNLDALEMEVANGNSGSMTAFLIKILGGLATTGLMLRHIKGSTFSRLGVFKFFDRGLVRGGKEQEEWLSSCPMETITLI